MRMTDFWSGSDECPIRTGSVVALALSCMALPCCDGAGHGAAEEEDEEVLVMLLLILTAICPHVQTNRSEVSL